MAKYGRGKQVNKLDLEENGSKISVTGEGAGYTSRYKFLPNYRHSRAGGNPLLNLGNCFSNISFLEFAMDSRLRGNDGVGVFGVVCL